MNSKKNVAIYVRLSNEDNDKINKNDNSESIKNQKNMLIDEINKHLDWKLYKIYCDEDLSGAGIYRKDFESMIKDCKNGKIDIVLCKSQSRFSRDVEVVEKYLNNKFIVWGVRFIGLVDNVDTSDINNKKSRQINGLVNEWYLEEVSNNIRSAFKIKMKKGEYISPFAPYGYKISTMNKNILEVDIFASKVVKKIYELYIQGYGYGKIADYLNENFISSPALYKRENGCKLNIVTNRSISSLKWNSSSVKTILTNEVYTGVLIQGKRTTASYKNKKIIKNNESKWIKKENTHECIINKNKYNKVQLLRSLRSKSTGKSKEVHLLSKKVVCKNCSKYMCKNSSSMYDYLVCRNKYCTNKISIRYDLLTAEIFKKVTKNENRLLDKMSQIVKDDDNSISLNENRKIKILKDSIHKYNEYICEAYQDKLENLINEEQYMYIKKKYENIVKENNNKINLIYKREQSKMYSKAKEEIMINRFFVENTIDKIIVDKRDGKYIIIINWL